HAFACLGIITTDDGHAIVMNNLISFFSIFKLLRPYFPFFSELFPPGFHFRSKLLCPYFHFLSMFLFPDLHFFLHVSTPFFGILFVRFTPFLHLALHFFPELLLHFLFPLFQVFLPIFFICFMIKF